MTHKMLVNCLIKELVKENKRLRDKIEDLKHGTC